MRGGGLWLCGLLLASSLFAAEPPVREVTVAGNVRIERDAILAVVKTKAGAPLASATLQEDVRAIYRMGYFRDVRAEFDKKTGVLRFNVDEKKLIRELKFEGNEDQETEDLEKEVQTKAFAYYDAHKVKQDEEKLRRFYDSKGLYLAQIRTEFADLGKNEGKLTFKIVEGKKVFVRQIQFIGNKVFSDGDLKSVLRTKEKGFLSFLTGSGLMADEAFAEDRQRLRDHYGHFGYLKVKIAAPRVQLAADKRSLSITILLEEGEKYRVGKIDLSGELLRSREELLKKIKTKEGKIADTRVIHEDIMALTTVYADDGYAYANVNLRDEYNDSSKVVNLTYVLQPGQKVYIEKIRFQGNDSTRDKVLRREMRIHEGDLYSATKIKESKANIDRLALFEDVRLSQPRGTADDKVDLVVEIKEKPTGTFSIGAGFNTLESFQIIGQIQKRNLFGYGVDISIQARLGSKTQAYNLQYTDEHFLDTKVGLTVNAFNIKRIYDDFDLTSQGASVGFDYPLYQEGLHRIRTGATYNIIDQELADIRSTVDQLFTGGLTSSMTFSLSRDTRNRVFEPSRGSFLKVTEEVAGGPLAGDNSFSKSEFDARWFFPLLEASPAPVIGDSVFALHFATGYVSPLKDGERVPIFERYYPGGIFTIRGFELRSLGPEHPVATIPDPTGFGTTDFATGGNKQIYLNAEYIFPIVRVAGIKGVFFFDIGNAFDNDENMFTITGQRQAAGFGIRWFSPIGPLRFEWGFPLDRKEDESFVVFDFTIGTLF